ncbi:Hypothetical predicted protein [Cloeon dipterum]|uniref:Uncharacterized protein n=1 Tax=Cloeon dipterum TaxID=197152 RepID=A0A8S1D486_9INSE|nr:Hypothetical predicted protein [Cloeon dipterum]
MQSGGKFQLVLISICLQIFTCSSSSLTFQHRNFSSWEILIGANEKEFQYDFCRYDASENIERCKNKARATVDIGNKCNCSVNHTENAKADSVYFTMNCNNQTLDGLMGGCPQKLTITYEHGDVFHPDPDASAETPHTCDMHDKILIIFVLLFSLSLVVNVVLGISLFMHRKKEPPLDWENREKLNEHKQTDEHSDDE